MYLKSKMIVILFALLLCQMCFAKARETVSIKVVVHTSDQTRWVENQEDVDYKFCVSCTGLLPFHGSNTLIGVQGREESGSIVLPHDLQPGKDYEYSYTFPSTTVAECKKFASDSGYKNNTCSGPFFSFSFKNLEHEGKEACKCVAEVINGELLKPREECACTPRQEGNTYIFDLLK